MFEVTLENKKGNIVSFVQNENYAITSIIGLGAVDAIINTTSVGSFDGERFNSSRLGKRNIVMTIAILGNVERNRIALYKVLKPKEWIKFNYKNGLRNVYIEGYIESAPIDLFTQNQEIQVSILCPDPYFKDAEEIIEDMNLIINMFYFPFAIEEEGTTISEYEQQLEKLLINNGDVSRGIIIELRALGEVINPKILNKNTAEFFGLNITMQKGDLITISTIKGRKTVYLFRDGIETNIFNNIMKGISWLELDPGDNVFIFETEKGSEYLNITFNHTDNYEGV